MSPHSALCLLPDPVQPFAASVYSQRQQFYLPKDNTASLILLDWVSEGRTAHGEKWGLARFSSRNDVYEEGHAAFPGGRRLLIRDSLILHGDEGQHNAFYGSENLASRMDGLACVSTLIIRGPRFSNLASHIIARFEAEPRIGSGGKGWNWDKNRQEEGSNSRFRDMLWTAANVRGVVLVKVSSKEIEQTRWFLRDLLVEGNADKDPLPDIVREFGLDCLQCLE